VIPSPGVVFSLRTIRQEYERDHLFSGIHGVRGDRVRRIKEVV